MILNGWTKTPIAFVAAQNIRSRRVLLVIGEGADLAFTMETQMLSNAEIEEYKRLGIIRTRNQAQEAAYKKISLLMEEGVENFSVKYHSNCFFVEWVDAHDYTERMQPFSWSSK